MPCSDVVCGTGGWTGPLPGDPSNNAILSAVGKLGGIEVSWTYPTLNAYAVMHTKVYRGTSPIFELAAQIHIEGGSKYFDRIEHTAIQRYYYWIELVSVNGTIGGVIGPADAYPIDSLSEVIERLTGLIDSGYLAESLRSDIQFIYELDTKLVQEIQDRLAYELISSDALSSVQLDLDEYLALLQSETTERINNVSGVIAALNQEATLRADAIYEEAHQRNALANENAETALRSVLSVHAELLDRMDDIALARYELTQSFTAGVAAEAQARLDLLAKTTTDTIETRALIVSESTARTDAISSEASQRNLLAAQLRGNYEGADLGQVTQGLFYQERQARTQLGYALAEQITLLSAGQAEQFDWNSMWYFDTGEDGWTGTVDPVATGGWLRPANHATDPSITSPAGLAVESAKYSQVRLRIRKVGIPVFNGYIWWKTSAQPDWLDAQKQVIDLPDFDSNGVGLIVTIPYWSGTLDQIKLVLSTAQTATDYFTIDWVAIGRPAPGASSSQLLELERVTVDTVNSESLASKITTLATSVNHPVTGLAATKTLITNDYYTKSTADAATASAQNVLLAEFGNKSSKTYRQSTMPVQGTSTVTLADGTSYNVPNLKVGDLWFNTEQGNQPFIFDGTTWVYSPDSSAAYSTAFINKLEDVLTDADTATVTSWRDAVASVVDPSTGLAATRGQISEMQTINASEGAVNVVNTRTQIAASNQLAETSLQDVINLHKSDTLQASTLAAYQESLNTRITEGSLALVEQKEFLVGKVNDVAGYIEQINTITTSSGSSNARTLSRIETQIDDSVSGLSKAHAHIANINDVRVDSTSAAASSLANMMAVVNHPTSGLVKAHSDITSINDVSSTSSSALARSVNTLQSRFTDFDSGQTVDSRITGYAYSKSSTDGAIASQASFLKARSDLSTSKVFSQTTAPTKRGVDVSVTPNVDIALQSGDVWIDVTIPNGSITKIWTGSDWQVTIDIPAVDARISNVETTKIGYATKGGIPFDNGGLIVDKSGVDAWNITYPAIPLVWKQGIPLATAVKQVSVTTSSGNTIAIEQLFQTTENLGATYTAKLTNEGLIGGFGLYNNATTVEAGFDVDKFWIGRTAANKKKPFIVTDNVVYIDDAAINKLTFSKLRDDTGAFVVQGGKVKAEYIDATTLNVGGQINVGAFTGYAWPAAGQGGVHLSRLGILVGNYNGGGKYFELNAGDGTGNAFINTNIPAYLEDFQVTNAKIGNLQVDTMKIANNAVTVSTSGSWSTSNHPTTLNLYLNTNGNNPQGVTIFLSFNVSGAFSLKRNGATILTFDGGIHSHIFIDYPGVGSHTYTITQDASSSQYYFSNGTMVILATLK